MDKQQIIGEFLVQRREQAEYDFKKEVNNAVQKVINITQQLEVIKLELKKAKEDLHSLEYVAPTEPSLEVE